MKNLMLCDLLCLSRRNYAYTNHIVLVSQIDVFFLWIGLYWTEGVYISEGCTKGKYRVEIVFLQ